MNETILGNGQDHLDPKSNRAQKSNLRIRSRVWAGLKIQEPKPGEVWADVGEAKARSPEEGLWDRQHTETMFCICCGPPQHVARVTPVQLGSQVSNQLYSLRVAMLERVSVRASVHAHTSVFVLVSGPQQTEGIPMRATHINISEIWVDCLKVSLLKLKPWKPDQYGNLG